MHIFALLAINRTAHPPPTSPLLPFPPPSPISALSTTSSDKNPLTKLLVLSFYFKPLFSYENTCPYLWSRQRQLLDPCPSSPFTLFPRILQITLHIWYQSALPPAPDQWVVGECFSHLSRSSTRDYITYLNTLKIGHCGLKKHHYTMITLSKIKFHCSYETLLQQNYILSWTTLYV